MLVITPASCCCRPFLFPQRHPYLTIKPCPLPPKPWSTHTFNGRRPFLPMKPYTATFCALTGHMLEHLGSPLTQPRPFLTN